MNSLQHYLYNQLIPTMKTSKELQEDYARDILNTLAKYGASITAEGRYGIWIDIDSRDDVDAYSLSKSIACYINRSLIIDLHSHDEKTRQEAQARLDKFHADTPTELWKEDEDKESIEEEE